MKSIIVSCELSRGLSGHAARLVKKVMFLPRSLSLKLVSLGGIPKFQDAPFSLVYAGEGESLEYLKNLYFQEVRQEKISSLPLGALRKKIKEIRSGNVFLIVEVDQLLNFLIPPQGFLTFPWVRQIVFLKSSAYLQKRRYIEETIGRKVRKYHYTFRIARDRDSVERFYYDFYLPYTKNKYKDLSHPRSLEEFLGLLNSGFLLQVLEKDTWVSGIMCQKKAREVTVFALGLLPDYDYNLRRGALSAADYFVFRWAENNGIKTVSLLRSRPHVFDGVYVHKQRWGAVAENDGWPHTSLWIFPPQATELPLILRKQLIWKQGALVELGIQEFTRSTE